MLKASLLPIFDLKIFICIVLKDKHCIFFGFIFRDGCCHIEHVCECRCDCNHSDCECKCHSYSVSICPAVSWLMTLTSPQSMSRPLSGCCSHSWCCLGPVLFHKCFLVFKVYRQKIQPGVKPKFFCFYKGTQPDCNQLVTSRAESRIAEMCAADESHSSVRTRWDWLQHVDNLYKLDSHYLQTLANLFEHDCIQSELDHNCLETGWPPSGDPCSHLAIGNSHLETEVEGVAL